MLWAENLLLKLLLFFLYQVIGTAAIGWKDDGCFIDYYGRTPLFEGKFQPRNCVIACKRKSTNYIFAGLNKDKQCYCYKSDDGLVTNNEPNCFTRYRLEIDIIQDVALQSNILIEGQALMIEISFYPQTNKNFKFADLTQNKFWLNNQTFEDMNITDWFKKDKKIYSVKYKFDFGNNTLCVNFTDLSDFSLYKCLKFQVIKKVFTLQGGYKIIGVNRVALKIETHLNLTFISPYFMSYEVNILPNTVKVSIDNMNRTRTLYFPQDGSYSLEIIGHGDVKKKINYFGKNYFLVQRPIKQICMFDTRAVTGKLTLFRVNITEGPTSDNNYTWKISNDTVLETDVPYLNYTLNAKLSSFVSVQVVASNHVSYVVLDMVILMEEDLSEIKIFAEPNPVIEGGSVYIRTNLQKNTSAYVIWLIDKVLLHSHEIKYSAFTPGRKEIVVNATIKGYAKGSAVYTLYVIKRISPFQLHYNLLNRYLINLTAEFFVEKYDSFGTQYKPSYFWEFGDNERNQSSSTWIVHKYPTNGTFTAQLNITNIMSSAVSNLTVVLKKDPCNVQIFFPWKYKNIKRFLLKDKIRIIPVIVIEKCQNTKISYLWEITDSRESVGMKSYSTKHLEVLAKDLGISFFTFQFKVQLVSQQGEHTVFERIYNGEFSILHSGIKINFENYKDQRIIYQIINRNYPRNIVFNASNTFDIDNPSADLKFNWTCSPQVGDQCFVRTKIFTTPCLIVHPSMFVEIEDSSRDLFFFKLTVTNEKTEMKSESFVYLKFEPAAKKRSSIKCLSCAGNKQSFEDLAHLQFNCPQCNSAFISNISWSVSIHDTDQYQIFHRMKKQKCASSVWQNYQNALWNASHFSDDVLQWSNKTKEKVETNSMYQCSERFQERGLKDGITLSTDKPYTVEPRTFIPYSNGTKPNSTKPTLKPKYWKNNFENAIAPLDPFALTRNFLPIKKEDFVYSDNKAGLTVSISDLIPGTEYMFEVSFQVERLKFVTSRMFFIVNKPPKEWKCEVTSQNEGIELKTFFQLKCLIFKSKFPMTYTLERYDEIENEYSIILVTNAHYMNFILHHSQHKNVKVRLTLQDESGEKLILCPFNFVVNSDRFDTMRISAKIRSISIKDEKDLNYIITVLQKYLSIPGSTFIFQTTCDSITVNDLNDHPLMVGRILSLLVGKINELNSSCVDNMVAMLKQFEHFNSSSQHYLTTLYSDSLGRNSFKVLSKLISFYQRYGSSLETEPLVMVGYNLHKAILHKNKINEFYANFTSNSVDIYGIKKIIDENNLKFPNGFEVNFIGYEKNKCIDIGLHVFKYSKLPRANIFFEKCWTSQSLVLPSEYTVKFPTVRTTMLIYTLHWQQTNHHQFNVKETENLLFFHLQIHNKSENSLHFNFTLTLRSNNSNVILEKIYEERHEGLLDIFYSSPHQDVALDLAVSTNAVNPLYRKKIVAPWFVYSLGIRDASCQIKSMDQSSVSCAPSFESRINQLICRCNGTGLVTSVFNNVEEIHVVGIEDTSGPKSLILFYGIIVLTLIFVLWIIYIVWKSKNFRAINFLDLPENYPCDNFEYHILVETGYVPNAGTSSRICAILYGTSGHSEKIELTFQKKSMFQRCAIACVAVRCPHHLGNLTYLKLWHDAKGEAKEWYLKNITIKDKLYKKLYYFPLFNWLSFSRGLKKTHVVIEAREVPASWNIQIFCESYIDFHDWLSILFGHSKPRYTKVERLFSLFGTILYLVLASDFYKNESFMDEDIYLLGLLHIQSWELLCKALWLLLWSIPFRMLFAFIFRIAASTKTEYGYEGQNKVADLYYLEKRVNPTYNGALYYSNSTVEGEAGNVEKTSAAENEMNEKMWNLKLSYSKRMMARFCLIAFILTSIGLNCYHAAHYTMDSSMKILQLVFIAILFDIFVVSNVFSILLSIFVSKRMPVYADIFAQFSHYLLRKRIWETKMVEETGNEKVYVRNRARFIRYAEPYDKKEMKKKHIKSKKETFKKCVRELWVAIALLIVAIILYENEVKNDEIVRGKYEQEIPRNKSTALWSTIENEVITYLNSSSCQKPDLLDNMDFTQEPVIINPVCLTATTVNGERTRVFLHCQRSPLRQGSNVSDIKRNFVFNTNISSVHITYVLMFKRSAKNIYISREIIFEKMLNEVYGMTRRSNQIKYESFCLNDARSIFLFVVKVILFVLVCGLTYWGFSRLFQYGGRGIFKLKRSINILVSLFSCALLVICLMNCIVGYLLETSLNEVRLSMRAENNDVFEYVKLMSDVIEATQVVVATLYFVVIVRMTLLLKLIPRNHILIRVMSSTLPTLKSYMCFVFLAIIACSHFWYILISQESQRIMSYGDIIEYVILHLPRCDLRPLMNSTLHMTLSTICSIFMYFIVRLSFIFFVGQMIYIKRRKIKKVVTLGWLIRTFKDRMRKDWMKMKALKKEKDPKKRFLQFIKRQNKKDNSQLCKMRKKYILDEIDYQSEELLYRVNKLAQLEIDYDSQIRKLFFRCNNYLPNDDETYFANEDRSDVGSSTDSALFTSDSTTIDSSSCHKSSASIIFSPPVNETQKARKASRESVRKIKANDVSFNTQAATNLSVLSVNSIITSPVTTKRPSTASVHEPEPCDVQQSDLSKPFTRPNMKAVEPVADKAYSNILGKLEELKHAEKSARSDIFRQIESRISQSGTSDQSDSGFGSFDKKHRNVEVEQFKENATGVASNNIREGDVHHTEGDTSNASQDIKKPFPLMPKTFIDETLIERRDNERRELFNSLLEKIISRKTSYLHQYIMEESDFDLEEDSYV